MTNDHSNMGKLRVGGVKDGMVWTGGSFIETPSNPRTINAYSLSEFKYLARVEESCTEGLAARFCLYLASNSKINFTLMQWIEHVRVYRKERVLDSVFHIFNYKKKKKHTCLTSGTWLRINNRLNYG